MGKKKLECQCTSPITYRVLVKLGETGELSVNAIKGGKKRRGLYLDIKTAGCVEKCFLHISKHQRLRMELFGK